MEVSINVYSCEDKRKEVWPLKISKRRDIAPINLLLLNNRERSHYTLIKDFNRLLSQKARGWKPKLFCYYCLHGFTKDVLMKKRSKNIWTVAILMGGRRFVYQRLEITSLNFQIFIKC